MKTNNVWIIAAIAFLIVIGIALVILPALLSQPELPQALKPEVQEEPSELIIEQPIEQPTVEKAAEETEKVPSLVSSSFDDGTTQGWIARMGSERISVTDEDYRSGGGSLKVSGRAQAFMGPALDVLDKLIPGERYEISVWVKLPAGANQVPMVLSAQRTKDGVQSFDNIVRGVTADSNKWVELTGTYQFKELLDDLKIYIETVEGLGDFFIDDFSVRHIPVASIQTDIPALRKVFLDNFSIGAAVEPIHLSGRHKEMLNMHYDSLVAENVMKPIALQPQEGNFTFANADRIRDYAEENNMKLRFHVLVWHNQVPEWFFLDENGRPMVDETDSARREANKNLLLDRMETHIRTVVERYKDYVDYWEVVNEVIDPNEPSGMRNSEWYRITGKEFIKRAFEVAREAAGEDAILSINDYNTHNPQKRDILFDLVMYLKEQGIRVDVIGHQTHINVEYPSIDLVLESIRKFGEAGFRNHITELDISVYRYGDHSTRFEVVPEDLLLRLAHRYRELFSGLRKVEEHIDDVTFWGIADDHTWLHNRPVPRRDAPFLFDENFQAKEAFWAVVDPYWTPSQ